MRLRFHDGKSLRAIADELELEPAYVHHQFAKARRDFKRALERVLRERLPGATVPEIEEECQRILEHFR